ncbi:uncharacterized protein DNG_05045 [Cephalotrichum gorgonifer]|uniref:NmrA-like domain-containing protein n=1 Tax=Cephalotrichum gorgonifer TaxID=2041049 RepID=A0AAE8SVX7_9PEZI|nr:uncharacterized protein DNG_05045 [Cephalotrichum gorgonifer]
MPTGTTVFVSGATGTQGGAVARHLRKANVSVHALVRDPSSSKAKALETIGVTLFPGSFADEDALRAALKGAQSAFLNFIPTFSDLSQELRDAEIVLAAAKEAGVRHIVYTSSFGLDIEKDPDPDGIVARVYQIKKDIVTAVVSAGFESYTILRPAKFMSDLFGPAVRWFGDLAKTGVFETALREGEAGPWVDPDDIGAFGAAALTDRKRFAGQRVDVYTELLTPESVIASVAKVTGKKMSIQFLPEVEVLERKKVNLFLQAQISMRDMGALADMDRVRSWGVPLGSFQGFLEREKAALDETYAQLPDAE